MCVYMLVYVLPLYIDTSTKRARKFDVLNHVKFQDYMQRFDH